MKNKKVLIILGVVLLLAIVFLTIYALNLKQPLSTEPSQIKPPQTSQVSRDLERERKKLELEKIKRGLASIKNESLDLKDLTPETEGCEVIEGCEITEEAEKYEEKVKAGAAKVVQGTVIEKASSQVTIEFKQSSFSWTSVVKIDQSTSMKTINKDHEEQIISLSDIQIGDTLVVKSTENITGESFVAVSVYRLN